MPQPFKNPTSGLYYFRMRVPRELRPILGHEYKRSLKTREPGEAKARYPEELLGAQQAFARAKAQLAGAALLTDQDVEQLAARWYRQEASKMEAQGSYSSWLVQGETAELETASGVEVIPIERPLRETIEDEDDESNLAKSVSRNIEQALRDANLTVAEKALSIRDACHRKSPSWVHPTGTLMGRLIEKKPSNSRG